MHTPLRPAARAAHSSLLATATLLSAFACGAPPQHDLADAEVEPVAVERAALAAGSYTLRPRGSSALCLQPKGGQNADGTRVVLARCDDGKAQQWVRKGNLWVTLDNRCLNVTGGSNRNGTRLQVWTCSDNDLNNAWTLADSQVQWKKNPKMCLDVVDGVLAGGTELQLWACDTKKENPYQLFRWPSAGAPANDGSAAGPPKASTPTTSAPAPAPAKPAQASGAKPASGHANVASRYPLVGPSPVGLDVAPYFWTWAQWGDYPTRTLREAMQKADLQAATLSFELSKAAGVCQVAGNFAGMADDIQAFRAAGKRVILSFGGATDNPPYLQKSCGDATSLANVIGTQVDAYDAHSLDFDIEGDNLGDTTSNNRLIDALQELQARYADLYVAFTLPVDAYSGLPSTAVALLQRCVDKGVRVSRVNLMTMDYGQLPPQGKSSADMVLGSVDATVGQLKKLYPNVDEATVYHMVGITPLIGQNDPPGSGSFYFTVSDARAVAAYAKQRGVGLLSYWGLMRDRSGSHASNSDYSNTPQKDFEFYNTFRGAQ